MGRLQDAVARLGVSMVDVKPESANKPAPNAWYHVKVTSWKETESGEGANEPGTLMYQVGVRVVGGEYAGHFANDLFYIGGDSAESNLKAMKLFLVSAGIDQDDMKGDFEPTTEWGQANLIDRELDCEFGFKKGKGDYRDGNNLRDYKAHMFTDADLM